MKMLKYISLAMLLAPGLTSCDEFLDRQPDEALNEEKVFEKRATTESYLYYVYSYMPEEWNAGDNAGWIPASDEGLFSLSRDFTKITNGSWNPGDVPYDKWTGKYSSENDYKNYKNYYRGIREATYFMSKVDLCPELSAEEKVQYKAEARFLRSFYYYQLMRMYGPVILTGNDVVDISSPTFNQPRNSWDECVKYVCDEMDSVARILPDQQLDLWLGKPTKGVALAVKSIVTLLDASPLFNNPDRSKYLYADVKNADGTPLFPQSYDKTKWAKAAKAAKDVIDLNQYDLYRVYDNDGEIDPFESLTGIFTERWNSEIIFGRSMDDSWWYLHTTPRGTNSYGVYSSSQNQVDAFAMKNGRFPITGYNGIEPIVDPKSGYTERGFRDYTNPVNRYNQTVKTYQMYCDREPRFYAYIIWNGMGYPYPSSRQRVQFYYGSDSGPGASHDYAKGGYLIRKAVRNDINPENNQWDTKLSWVIIRLGEIYLNYVEALIESDPGNADILIYWNLLRERAGLPDIDEAYPEAVGNQELMRDLIRKERRVELCFESRRYFDTRRWQIAEQTDVNIYQMNINGTDDSESGDYWQRKLAEVRPFEPKFYLYPIAQSEIEKNKAIIQNYGW